MISRRRSCDWTSRRTNEASLSAEEEFKASTQCSSRTTFSTQRSTEWNTLHGGIGLTMAKIRENHWIPRLRQLAKRVIRSCWGLPALPSYCLRKPTTGSPSCRPYKSRQPFRSHGVWFRRSPEVPHQTKGRRKGLSCSLRVQFVPGPLLGGVTKLGTSEFLSSLKRFIARWGRPAVIYSDNGRTSVGAAQWLKQVRGDENL